jgi:DNA-binding PadR family transcriptional regulator
VTSRKAYLGELETLVMLAVLRLEGDASVGRIREEVAERGGRALSRGATYDTVARLERKGYLSISIEAPGAGARPVHHFSVTKRGLATLRIAQQHLIRMRAGLESILKVAK